MHARRAVWPLLLAVLPAFTCYQGKVDVELPVWDQDINEHESDVADRAIKILLGMPNIQMVYCRRADQYEVHGKAGKLFYKRNRGPEGYSYEVTLREGRDPLANQDPKAHPELKGELALGDNPKGTDYTAQDKGYTGPTDPRISFPDGDKVAWPLAYERIAALFDGKDTGDLVIEFTPWGWAPLGVYDGLPKPGAHGHLHEIASRAPIIFAGKGAQKKKVVDAFIRSVDIAPTVAKAMGIQKTFGVDEKGHYSQEVYLKWQDGHVLDEALSGESPTYVLMIMNDALMHSELMNQLQGDAPLPTYRWMVENGTLYKYGAIVNFPSNTYPSHNAIGTGAYSGHHGLVDNWFYDRRAKKRYNPILEVFDTDRFIVDEVETLFQAVHRSFPTWHPEKSPLGNFVASFSSPITKGADLALFEGVQPIDWDKCPEPDGLPFPPTDETISTRAQAADNLGIMTLVKAYVGTYERDGKKLRCSQVPRLGIINLGLTDDEMHRSGPHSDGARRAMAQTDVRMGIIFDTLKKAGIFDKTMIVLTSDHGQALQDVQRNQEIAPVLEKAGIRFQAKDVALLYLLVNRVLLSTKDFVAGQQTTVDVTVQDDDTEEPVPGATVTFVSGNARVTAKTDAQGKAQLTFTPGAAKTQVTVTDGKHTDFDRSYP